MAGEIQLNSTTALTEDTGAITLNNVNSATNRTNLGLGSIATQASDSIDINGGTIDGTTIGGTSAAAGTFTTFTSTGIDDNASSTALTIDSNGNLGINTTNILGSSLVSVDGSGKTVNGLASKVNNVAYYTFVGINPSGTNTFLVYGDGDVENTNNSYGAISDERLKSNIEDASSQIDDIMTVQVRSYTLNETGDKHIGVIAQELESSGMSGLIKINKEGIKSVKYSVLYMKAIKALQEAVSKIELLESRIETLENA